MEVTRVDLRPSQYDGTVAYGSACINGEIFVNVSIRQGRDGNLFVSVPARKSMNKQTGKEQWYDEIRFTSQELREYFNSCVLAAAQSFAGNQQPQYNQGYQNQGQQQYPQQQQQYPRQQQNYNNMPTPQPQTPHYQQPKQNTGTQGGNYYQQPKPVLSHDDNIVLPPLQELDDIPF